MRLRTLVHSNLYTSQLKLLGGVCRLDDVLCAVEWSLARRPETYRVVKNMQDIRLLKTDAQPGIPALRVWFRIRTDEEVHLLYIELNPPMDEP